MKKVLIVDDSPTTRAVVKVYLSGQSLLFLEADNGTDAMRIALDERPDAIIIDLKMPGMDGLTFIRRARMSVALQRTPIILITGQKSPELKTEAMRTGASHFLTKPIDVPLLAKLIMRSVGLEK
ncbi:MAG TPA: response regulator [Pseudomonadota bacterium]|nr:response regulator [Pseudomonadota bacterium]